MNPLKLPEIAQYVEEHIGPQFHSKKVAGAQKLKLKKLLRNKNPYLFKANNILTAEEFVRALLEAHFSSGEEGIFGNFLEGLAVFICERVYDGKKSSTKGIDLEFTKDNVRYLVAIKSGPKWGNSSQIAKMEADFVTARKTLGTSGAKINSVFVNGCCYGKEPQEDKGSYLKLCGKPFWELISGNPSLYTDLIEPIGYKAEEQNNEVKEAQAILINKFTAEFIVDFVKDGRILWDKLVRFNSGESNI